MMKSKYIPSLTLIIAMGMAFAPACMAGSYVLLVEQTPIEGGIISPGVGVHSFTPGETVTLTATPRPGYQFVRWMGDVSATDTSTTIVTLDTPKVLVAVFERVEFALLDSNEESGEDEGLVGGGGGGGGGGQLTRQNIAIGGGGGASPASTAVNDGPSFIFPPEEDIPNTNGKIPVTVPEPGTIAIMVLGANIVLLRRKS